MYNKNQDGYQQARELIQESNSVASLTKAVEKAMAIVKEFGLDDYQVQQLEQLGTNKFGQIEREGRQMIRNDRLTF